MNLGIQIFFLFQVLYFTKDCDANINFMKILVGFVCLFDFHFWKIICIFNYVNRGLREPFLVCALCPEVFSDLCLFKVRERG